MSNVRSHPWIIGLLAGWFLLVFTMIALTCNGCVPGQFYTGALRPEGMRAPYTVLVETVCVSGDPFSENLMKEPSVYFGYGSGVMLDERHVLTANHVVLCPFDSMLYVVDAMHVRHRVTVDRTWPEHDFARLVLAPSESFGAIHPILFNVVHDDDRVCSQVAWPVREGNCGTVEKSYTRTCPVGEYSGKKWCYDTRVMMRGQGGNSGAPVYSEHGSLVGLVTGASIDESYALISTLGDIISELYK